MQFYAKGLFINLLRINALLEKIGVKWCKNNKTNQLLKLCHQNIRNIILKPLNLLFMS